MMQLGRGRAAAVLKATTIFDDPDGIQAAFDAEDAAGSIGRTASPGKTSRWLWPTSREPSGLRRSRMSRGCASSAELQCADISSAALADPGSSRTSSSSCRKTIQGRWRRGRADGESTLSLAWPWVPLPTLPDEAMGASADSFGPAKPGNPSGVRAPDGERLFYLVR
ncbi:hypothetical protein AHiyo1_01830 [Arthrobacter sp. Hiyo1]|nr:hypothetical protein AHiyo1_01830 [Arthrobacter sp. Hiyo1]